MALTHRECQEMVQGFQEAEVPLWVAYYRRALPRFLLVRQLLAEGAIGRLTSVHVSITRPLAAGQTLGDWRFRPEVAGAGLFFDLASHCFDLLDFVAGPIGAIWGAAANTGGAYEAEDVTAAAFQFEQGAVGTGIWNFNAGEKTDQLSFIGARGDISTAMFADVDVLVTAGSERRVYPVRNPPHVHQPLVQTIVDELRGRGTCPSTGETAARASWAMEQCVKTYYRS
jgi:predicted dehydrogenase